MKSSPEALLEELSRSDATETDISVCNVLFKYTYLATRSNVFQEFKVIFELPITLIVQLQSHLKHLA